jgi:outer membrane protein assembly factor BamC
MMSNPHASSLRTTGRWALSALAFAALAGCSVLEETKVDYQSAQRGNTLEVPPDLTQIARDSRFDVGTGAVSATGFEAGQQRAAQTQAATNQVGDVRIERAGNQRWLVINRPPEALWDPLRQFWTDAGFKLQVDQPDLGILETDWAENRANIPQDVIRRTLGRVFDSLYDSGQRDRFRTRVERNAQGQTEIFISHRRMEEVYTSQRNDSTVWQPRPANVELETEFLRRLMLRLGATEAQVQAEVNRPANAVASTANGLPVVQLKDDLERAWRRVGLALDRTGFTVEDRDRPQGVYFVRYVEPTLEENKPGFFSRLTGSASKPPVKLRIVVAGSANGSVVSVLNEQGQPDGSATAQNIVKLLTEELR